MNGVTTREHLARDQHHIAHLKLADLFFGDWRAQHFFLTSDDEAGAGPARHPDRRLRFVAVEPAFDRAGLRVERDAQTPKRPAVISDRDEEARGQAILHTDLAADQRRVSAEAHRADT